MADLEETLTAADSIQVHGFDCVEIEAVTYPADDDLDSESRKVGLLQAQITTYKGD